MSNVSKDLSKLRRYFENDFQKGIDEIQSKYAAKVIFKSFDYDSLEVDEFALKAIVEREDDNIINRVRSICSRNDSQNDQVIAAW